VALGANNIIVDDIPVKNENLIRIEHSILDGSLLNNYSRIGEWTWIKKCLRGDERYIWADKRPIVNRWIWQIIGGIKKSKLDSSRNELCGGSALVLDSHEDAAKRSSRHPSWFRQNEGVDINPSSFDGNQCVGARFSSSGAGSCDTDRFPQFTILLLDGSQTTQSSPYAADPNKDQEHRWQVCGTKKAAEVAVRLAGGCYCLIFGCLFIYRDIPAGQPLRLRLRRIAGPTLVGLGLAAFLFPPYYQGDCEDAPHPPPFLNPSHSGNTVPQKYLLTISNYWGTVIAVRAANMANVLPMDKKIAVISALAEGSGIRQIERMTGINRNTIMNLGVRVGQGCANLLDRKMRNLSCEHLQFDELWGFIGKKQKHVQPDDNPDCGDAWTFCAIDSDTKLVPSFKVGKRTLETANAFVGDVANRMANRIQISTDGLPGYVEAVEKAFGMNVDYAQIVKVYESEAADAEVIRVDKRTFAGCPDLNAATTSHVERLNGTTRLHMRRLTRLTYAFSKKKVNFEAAVALHFAYYNFVKRHNTLRMTPAMAAGIERDFWTVGNLVEATV
jgi:IS1 family transposase